ncbi:ABC transporter permease [Streptomyces abyssalis]|uniref:ABC transporter permease n=1 Tax=Streptomyces abyssalis TaxID=933944 RepID=A0A1E7JNR4_9ACTN|nr:carbohydrate ABC transporter permease [Streptomyces abyssalis]OEU86691.1 ABC transporter permease [Streptomyces abyssalis]OEU89922.1 ABC transporter permease [Streptomyces abyssalis]OEV04442.1 ABC transporter permease [Streptomyces nanshensis]
MATAPAAAPGQTRTPAGPGPGSGGGRGSTRARGVRPRPLFARANIPAGAASLIWLLIVLVPLWCMLSWSVQSRDGFLDNGPLSLPRQLTSGNLTTVLEGGFTNAFVNTVIVTVVSVALTLVCAVPAAYAVVRSTSRFVAGAFSVFLLGLAIPAQAVIIPVYLMIVRMGLYDTKAAIILPTVAFGLPFAVLILAGSLRDVPGENYEAMTLDGAGPMRTLWSLVIPMSRGSIVAVGIYAALQAWNGFLFPLILTQSEEQQILTLNLWNFQTEYGVNVPGLMTAVLLSAAPVFIAYVLARRWIVAGLAGLGGK